MTGSNDNCCGQQQSGGNVDPEVRQRFDLLCTLGKQVAATSPDVDIKERPEYFNQQRFDRAQKTVLKHYTSLSMAGSVGLVLLLQFESILVPLLKTKQSKSVVRLWDRYANTAKYMKACAETKFYDDSSDGWRYLMIVRGMHQRVHKLMNEQFKHLLTETKDNELPIIWVNQYDMALTQFAFIGLLLLDPKRCAAYHISEQQLLDITYYWRLLSHYLGIEERFSIFAFDEDWPKQRQLLQLILDELYRKHLEENRNSELQKLAINMGQGFLLAFEELLTDVNYTVLDHWWSPMVSMSGLKQPQPYSISDRVKLARFSIIFKLMLRSKLVAKQVNKIYRKKFDKFYADGEGIKKRLAKKYGHLNYEENAAQNEIQQVAIDN